MSVPTLAYAERTLRQIDGDSADARKWRAFLRMAELPADSTPAYAANRLRGSEAARYVEGGATT